jgi:hypothetical protein
LQRAKRGIGEGEARVGAAPNTRSSNLWIILHIRPFSF